LLGYRLKEALEDLSPREQTILQLRFGFKGGRPCTLAEVGARLSISLERVRQIQKAALAKIRKGRRRSLLEQYA
ncbi:MAG: sigma-70 family RNA polymerase sigma factor, partial [Planctomycetota bacterium]